MATIESWGGKIADIGPMYPMVGTETVLVIIGVAVLFYRDHRQQRQPELARPRVGRNER